MTKINLGLIGIIIIIFMLIYEIKNIQNNHTQIMEDLDSIQNMLIDIDSDLHELEKK